VGTEVVEDETGARLLQIQIQDTGRGIAPENLVRLFEPFFTTKKHGTGLGLAISHRIIHGHRGSIQAQSKPGESTTFTISLPMPAVKDISQ